MKEIGSLYWVKSIEGYNFIKSNRCYILDEEEALKAGYSIRQFKRLQSRVKKIGTLHCFEKFGWMEEHPMIVYVLDGVKYLGDGQGRGLYATAYNANIDEQIKLGKATEKDYIMIPVREYAVDSYKEMHDRVFGQNSYGNVWNKMESVRAECMQSDNEDKIKGWELINHYTRKLELAESVVSDALYRLGSTKKDVDVIYLSRVRAYAIEYLEFLYDLYNICIEKGWKGGLLSRIRSGNFVRTMQYCVFDKITRQPLLTDEDKQLYFNEAKKVFLNKIPEFTVHQAVQLSSDPSFVGINMLKLLSKSKVPFFRKEFAYTKEMPNAFV